ncbi:gag/pol protein [Cucumis melo var. makuwa]|uniref:Gag/pol protein n=1 Tax=Cucumis melo var. makuwa TaxID=1194695 RepID=A0A5D3C3P6_CUCMM|nr:gag/pol protein [Cucumis melo var. makuwa]
MKIRMDVVHKFYDVKFNPSDLFITIKDEKFYFNVEVINELYNSPNDAEYLGQEIVTKSTKGLAKEALKVVAWPGIMSEVKPMKLRYQLYPHLTTKANAINLDEIIKAAILTWMEIPKEVMPFPSLMEKLCLKFLPSLVRYPQKNIPSRHIFSNFTSGLFTSSCSNASCSHLIDKVHLFMLSMNSSILQLLASEKLNGDNYVAWKSNLNTILVVDDLSMSDVLAKKHESLATTKEIMDSLKGMFGQPEWSLRHEAIKYIYTKRMKEGTSIREHVLDRMMHFNVAEVNGGVINEANQVRFILESFPKSFIPFQTNAFLNKIEFNLTTLLNELQCFQNLTMGKVKEVEANVATTKRKFSRVSSSKSKVGLFKPNRKIEKKGKGKTPKQNKGNKTTEKGKTIKTLQSDRGGKYMDLQFQDYLIEHGIQSQLSAPSMPHKYGVPKRRNRTLLDMVRSMMIFAQLSDSFWGYALETAIYILNNVPSKSVSETPYELWKGRKGYPKESKGGLLYDPQENKIFVSTNATFLEEDHIQNHQTRSKLVLEEISKSITDKPSSSTKEQCPKTPQEVKDTSNIPYVYAVGSLMYAMLCSRSNICYSVGIVSRYQSNPRRDHWTVVKNILKYLRRTKHYMLVYGSKDLILTGYTDSDFQSDKDARKSTSGSVFTLNGGAVVWTSIKESCIADSTMKVEYVPTCEAPNEAVWLKKFLTNLEIVPNMHLPITLYCDNSGVVANSREPRSHKHGKHIERKYHLIREIIHRGDVTVTKISSEQNIADPFTKALTAKVFESHLHGLGLCCL